MSPMCPMSYDQTAKPTLHSGSKVKRKSKMDMKSEQSKNDKLIDKKKSDKLMLKCSNLSKTQINGISGETIKKNIHNTNIAVNTLVSGPLRCDNNCVTSIQKRDKVGICRCVQKKAAPKVSIKQLQTYSFRNYSHSDKASAQCVESSSCGTQFLRSPDSNLKRSIHATLREFEINDTKIGAVPQARRHLTQTIIHETPIPADNQFHTNGRPKHWALTQYPTCGPDF